MMDARDINACAKLALAVLYVFVLRVMGVHTLSAVQADLT